MKQFILIFLILINSLLKAEDFHPLDVLEETHLDSALAKIKMTREDLTFNLTFTKKDSFRLSLIDKLFKTPLKTYNYADSIAEYHFVNFSNLDSLLTYDFSLLDLKTSFRSATSSDTNLTFPEIHPTNQKIISEIVSILALIMTNLDSAYSNFTQEDLEFIQENAPGLFQSEEDIEDKTLLELKQNEEESRKISKKFGRTALKLNREKLLRAGLLTANLVTKIEEIVDTSPDSSFFDDQFIYQTEYGKIAINPKNKIEDYIFVIDYNGDDFYNYVPDTSDSLSIQKQMQKKFSVVLDFSGNDIYQGENFCQGGGFWGIDMLIDYDGHDLYKAKNCSQGTGYFGIGILIDKHGNDNYIAETLTQGAGAYGLGLLLDKQGNDNYQCTLYGQGFGYCWGFGALIDKQGNDNYTVVQKLVDILRYDDHYESLSQGFGLGSRPYYSGGIGILADEQGNDHYNSDIYGQGSAYWFSYGSLVDKKGNDNYNSYQYAQGSGVHLAFGTLIDYYGMDTYSAKGVSQGCGHDYAFGGLFDFQGDDNYICYDLSQGGGNADAISIFIDCNGDDGYIAKRTNTMGYSDKRRGFGYIGIFMDLNGNDFYGSPLGNNNDFWIHSTYGIGMDSKNSYLDSIAPPKKYDMKPADEILGDDIETLFIQASAASQKFQYLVKPAREKIIAMGDSAMPFLVDKLDTESARESHALYNIIPKIGIPAVPYLEKILQDSVAKKIRYSILLLGKIKDTTSFHILAKYANDKNPSYRKETIKALGNLEDERAIPILINGLKDSITSIRRESAIALQKINNETAIIPLIKATADKYQEVRYSAQDALVKIGEQSTKIIKTMFDQMPVSSQKHLISVLENVQTKKNQKFLKKKMKNYPEF